MDIIHCRWTFPDWSPFSNRFLHRTFHNDIYRRMLFDSFFYVQLLNEVGIDFANWVFYNTVTDWLHRWESIFTNAVPYSMDLAANLKLLGLFEIYALWNIGIVYFVVFSTNRPCVITSLWPIQNHVIRIEMQFKARRNIYPFASNKQYDNCR